MTFREEAPAPRWTDQLEFELRLMPGVVAVAAHHHRVSIAANTDEAAERASDLVRDRLGPDVAIDLVTPPPDDPSAITTTIREVPGVRACIVRRDEHDRINRIEVTADNIRAADTVHRIVAEAFGQAFARDDLLVVLEVALTLSSPGR